MVTENSLPAERPPRDSRLGQLLIELGEYESYFETLRRGGTETQAGQNARH